MSLSKVASWEDGRRVFYSEFAGAVRKYEPLRLLRMLGDVSAQMPEFEGFSKDWAQISPWAVSAIARQSILSSKHPGDKKIDQHGFNRLVNLHKQIQILPQDEFERYRFLVGVTHDQSSYQLSAKEDLMRTMLLLTAEPVNFRNPKSTQDWSEALGAPFDDLAISTLSLYGLARQNKGIVTREQVKEFCLAPGFPSERSLLATLDRLTATVEEARADGLIKASLKGGLQKYDYNPLVRTPFIDLGNGVLCAPQTQFIVRSCSPESLYFFGQSKESNWSTPISTEFGYRIEAYVGQQLRHTGLLEVYPEIKWRKTNDASTDWFVVTPGAVILIECKAAHTTIATRAGATEGLESVVGKLRHGYKQLNTSAGEIRSGNPNFSAIPADRPIIGLVVTAEPIYLINSPEVRQLLPETDIPILSLALRDFENLAMLKPHELTESLLAITASEELMEFDLFRSLREVRGGASYPPNTLIDAAYVKYLYMSGPFADRSSP